MIYIRQFRQPLSAEVLIQTTKEFYNRILLILLLGKQTWVKSFNANLYKIQNGDSEKLTKHTNMRKGISETYL